MTQVDVEADLLVDDGAGDSRQLSVDDFKAAATGAATQTTLAALLAKVIAAPSTEAKQDATNALLTAIDGHVDGLEGKDFATQTTLAAILAAVDGLEGFTDGIEGSLTTLNSKDFATQTTLAAILAKIIAAPATEAKQDTGNTTLASILSAVDQLEGYTDTLESLISTLTTKLTDGSARVGGTSLVGSTPVTATTTATTVAATTTSGAALAANSAAKFRFFENNDTTNYITLKLGSGTVTDYAGVVLRPGGTWDGLIGDTFWTGAVAVKTVAGTATVSVVEG